MNAFGETSRSRRLGGMGIALLGAVAGGSSAAHADPTAPPAVEVPDGSTHVAPIGNEMHVTIVAKTSTPGATVQLTHTPLAPGMELELNPAAPQAAGQATYELRWTPERAATSHVACFLANDSTDQHSPLTCLTFEVPQTEHLFVTGIVRDFSGAHPDFAMADGDGGTNFVAPALGVDRRPV